MLIHVVADYGQGDLAFAEVHQQLVRHVPGAQVVDVPVGPFDTVAGGFCVAQLARNDGPDERAVYANIAPREDDDDPREANEGEPLALARLPRGDAGAVGERLDVRRLPPPPTDRVVYVDGYGNLKIEVRAA